MASNGFSMMMLFSTIINLVVIPIHFLLIRRAFRLADGFVVDKKHPFICLAMDAQRRADRSALKTAFFSGFFILLLAASTIYNLKILS